MKTYMLEIEKGKGKTEVIEIISAYTYGMRKEIEAITDRKITDEEFYGFCDFLMDNEVLGNAFSEFKEEEE